MGLDMFLKKYPKVNDLELWNMDYEEIAKNDPVLHAMLEPYECIHGDTAYFMAWTEYYSLVGYWRKANHIHKWFVINVQNGNDDCGAYVVEKIDIEELLEFVELLLNGEATDERASRFLPTEDGFFFGGTAYDEYYWMKTEETKTILTKCLKETDWDTEVIVYQASW